jgi:hypothetical protein
VVLAVVVVALARQIGVLHLRLAPTGALEIDEEGPPLGEAVPPLGTSTPDERRITLGGPGPRRLVVFVSATCPICEVVLPSIPAAASAHRLVPQVVLDPEVELAYDIPGVPFVLVLDEGGVVRAKGTVNSLEQLDGLVDTAVRRMTPPLEAIG